MKAEEIALRLIKNNYEAYYIGGYVRDFLLGKKSSDIDIVTRARPRDIKKLFNKDCDLDFVGKSFGVVIVDKTEVATYRKDLNKESVSYEDSLEKDVKRRDLTINSIAMNPITGEIVDYNNGIEDLSYKIIRFIGDPDKRIEEDPCRILRACRFYAYLEGTFDEDTLESLQKNSDLINKIAKERVFKELKKVMMTCRNASLFFKALQKIGALSKLFPLLYKTIGYTQNRYHKENLYEHLMRTGDAISCQYPVTKLAGYLHDIGKVRSMALNYETGDFSFIGHEKEESFTLKRLLTDLRFATKTIDWVMNLIELHMHDLPTTAKGMRKLLKTLNEKEISLSSFLRLRLADTKGNLSSHKTNVLSKIKGVIQLKQEVIKRKEAFSLKDLKIDGYDVMHKLNLKPGPKIGKILNKILELVMKDPDENERVNLLIKLKEFENVV